MTSSSIARRTIASSILRLPRGGGTTHPLPRRLLSAIVTPSSPVAAVRPFDKLGVVGLGLMGHGIVQAAASSKDVHSAIIAYESETSYLDRGRDRILSSVDRLVSKGKVSNDDASSLLSKITYTTDRDALIDVDLIVEAIIENIDLKNALYADLGARCKPTTVFASNTSSLSISKMALASSRSDKFVGIHFFNPVQLMKLVEVVRTEYTDPRVFENVLHWVTSIGKVGVSCRDTPGFIVNRLLVPNLMQAMSLVERGDATVSDVDLSMQLGAGHPMGPLHLADYIGLDTCLFIVEGWVRDYPNDTSFYVPDVLRRKVERNELGRKTGRGFYNWSGDKRGDPVE
jgi:3-hydroxyacyl-CoA dehydrogenase